MAVGVEFKAPEEYSQLQIRRIPQNVNLSDEQRVVVIGMGAISPVGLTVEENWHTVLAGKSGIDVISDEGRWHSEVRIAGEVKGFKPEVYLPAKEIKWVHRSAQLYIAAATEALVAARLMNPDQVLGKQPLIGVHPYDIGINAGSGAGGSNTYAETQEISSTKGDRKIPATTVMRALIDRVASVTGMNRFVKGPTYTTTAACASAGYAMAAAYDTIRMGRALVMLTGGADSSIDRNTLGAFNSIHALSTRNDEPQKASRPFDIQAAGFVNAEGAAALVLANYAFAKAIHAPILAELVGYGNTADAEHDTSPSGEGAIRAMQQALWQAGLEEVDYVNAHATSTQAGDPAEVKALKIVFGEKATKIPVSATKSMTGHMLGATGALEAIFTILAIRDHVVPPTINLDQPIDPDMDFVPWRAKYHPVETSISNTFGFGGMNNSLLFRGI